MLKIEGNFPHLRAKPAHFEGHLPATVEGVTWHVALVTPDMYYPCPSELAAKATFASDREVVSSRE
jgi:hypothetical protein